jgi:hypothetical protein
MTNFKRTTCRMLAEGLVALGMVPQGKADGVLAEAGEWLDDLDEELDAADLAEALVEFGAAVQVPSDDVDDLEDGYREILEQAVACSGGRMVLDDVELARNEDGSDSLHFLRNGESIWWSLEHQQEFYLDTLRIFENINDLEPDGDDPRRFRLLRAVDADEDDDEDDDLLYVLVSPEQARALHTEFGLDFDGHDAEKSPRGEPPTAESGTLAWYMQHDRQTMTEPARDFLDGWLAGMDEALARWRARFLPQDFLYDFSLVSLNVLAPIVLDRFPDGDAVEAAGDTPFIKGAVRYLGETLIRSVPSRWGYQDMGTSNPYDRIPQIRSNTPTGFMDTIVPLHYILYLADKREPGILRESANVLRRAVDRYANVVHARRG